MHADMSFRLEQSNFAAGQSQDSPSVDTGSDMLVKGNTVRDIAWDGPTWTATGLLFFDCAGSVVDNDVILDGEGEDDLVGKTVKAGTVELDITKRIARCVMVSRAQPGIAKITAYSWAMQVSVIIFCGFWLLPRYHRLLL